jgi:hypothetical protein
MGGALGMALLGYPLWSPPLSRHRTKGCQSFQRPSTPHHDVFVLQPRNRRNLKTRIKKVEGWCIRNGPSRVPIVEASTVQALGGNASARRASKGPALHAMMFSLSKLLTPIDLYWEIRYLQILMGDAHWKLSPVGYPLWSPPLAGKSPKASRGMYSTP